MAEDIKTKVKNYQPAPFDSHFPSQNQTRNCRQTYLVFHHCEKAMTCANDTSVHTSPSAPYPGCQPRTTTGQKACFLGRSEISPPHRPSVLCPSPRGVKGDMGTAHPGILKYGLTNKKYLLERCKNKVEMEDNKKERSFW